MAEIKDAAERGVGAVLILDDCVLLGDVGGDVLAYDARTRVLRKRFAGPGGAIRALVADPAAPGRFAAAGLDRHAHVWDLAGKGQKPRASVYCKQRLSDCVYVAAAVADASDDEDEDVMDESDEDDDEDSGS